MKEVTLQLIKYGAICYIVYEVMEHGYAIYRETEKSRIQMIPFNSNSLRTT